MSAVESALGMFTIVPVRSHELDARRGFRLFPVVGLGLGALAALPLVAIREWAPNATGPGATAVGATLAVALLAVLTRGLHLDGLADTADGLGSRAPAQRALAIMKQSDIGPFGVVTLVLVLLVDVLALAALRHDVWTGCAALAVAAGTGRVSALHASAAPVARPDGFGALVHDAVRPWLQLASTVSILAIGGLLAWSVGASWWWWPLVQAIALAAAFGFRLHTTRRFGGTTGDVYGALVEVGTAITLAGMCLR